MESLNLQDIPFYTPLTPDQKDQISRIILPKLSEGVLDALFRQIEKLVAFDRMANRPNPEVPLHRRLAQLSGQLERCLRTIDQLKREGTMLNNLDLHYWQWNDGDQSMQDLAEELRQSERHLLDSSDIDQVREFYSISGTVETLNRIQKAVSKWHKSAKPGSKKGRKPPSSHQGLILGLINFFDTLVPEGTYKVSASPGSKFETLISFIFSDVLQTGTTKAKDHIAYVLDKSIHIPKRNE